VPRTPGRRGPRERLRERGTESLDDAELLALLLRTGARGRPAEALARELLGGAGLHGLARAIPAELERQPGVGPAKAATLLAALEIARRLAQRRLGTGDAIRGPQDVFRHFHARLRDAPHEQLHLLLLDGRHRLLREVMASRGTLTASLVHPREVFRPALREGAAALVVVHNHPSGDPAPSPEDREVTRRLVQAGALLGVPLLDHVVVAERGWVSLREHGELGALPWGEAPAREATSRSRSPAGRTIREAMVDRSTAETRTAVERRRAERAPVTVRIEYSTVDALFSDFTRDVNEGGIFVETDEAVPLDEKVELKLRLPGSAEVVHARGRVVRVEPATQSSAAGIAIEFEQLDSAARDTINAAVRKLRKEPR
jgi:DNA repair protein RadC